MTLPDLVLIDLKCGFNNVFLKKVVTYHFEAAWREQKVSCYWMWVDYSTKVGWGMISRYKTKEYVMIKVEIGGFADNMIMNSWFNLLRKVCQVRKNCDILKQSRFYDY